VEFVLAFDNKKDKNVQECYNAPKIGQMPDLNGWMGSERKAMRKRFLLLVFAIIIAGMDHATLGEEPTLERIEWTDIWVVNANKDNLPRVLLVGDSIVKGYYSEVEKRLADKANCTRYATSMFMGNPDYLAELEILLKRYSFKVIQINNGLHGWGYTEQQYRDSLTALFAMLKEYSKGAVLIWATTTPIQSRDASAQALERTERTKERNRIATDFAKDRGIEVNDLYGLMEPFSDVHAGDGVHFNSKGNILLGQRVGDAILRYLVDRQDADEGGKQ